MSISLSVEPSGWTDAYGNIFMARTAIVRNGKTSWVYDVGLVTGR